MALPKSLDDFLPKLLEETNLGNVPWRKIESGRYDAEVRGYAISIADLDYDDEEKLLLSVRYGLSSCDFTLRKDDRDFATVVDILDAISAHLMGGKNLVRELFD